MSDKYPGDEVAKVAFDVMMRRGWGVKRLNNTGWWFAWDKDRPVIEDKGLEFSGLADPFTALVEADRWYKEHVEAIQ